MARSTRLAFRCRARASPSILGSASFVAGDNAPSTPVQIGGTDLGAGLVAGGTSAVTVQNGGTLQASSVTVQSGSTLTVDATSSLSTQSLVLAGGDTRLGILSESLSVTFASALPSPISKPDAAIAVASGQSGSLTVGAINGAAAVNDFQFGDSVDVTGTALPSGAANSFSFGSGSLTLDTPAGVTGFAQSDGNGGTLITAASTAVGLYRFYDTSNGSHLYTTSAAKVQMIEQTRPDVVYEGNNNLAAITAGRPAPTWFTSRTAPSTSTRRCNRVTPVYRFFESANGDYFHTDDAAERATILSTLPDLIAEGVAFYEPSR